MSMDVVRYSANLPAPSQLAPTVVVSSGGDLSKKHLGSNSRLHPLASDTLAFSKKAPNPLSRNPLRSCNALARCLITFRDCFEI